VNWFVPRGGELFSAKHAVESLNSERSSTALAPSLVHTEDDAASLAVARSAAWIAQIEELVGVSKSGDLEAAKTASDPSEELSLDAPPGCTKASFVSESGDDRLTIEFVPIGVTAAWTRAVLLACVVSGAAFATWFAERQTNKSKEKHQSTPA